MLVWDNAENNKFVPAGSPHHVHDINQASFIKAGFRFQTKRYDDRVRRLDSDLVRCGTTLTS